MPIPLTIWVACCSSSRRSIASFNLLTIDVATTNKNGGRLTAKGATVVAALDSINNVGGTIDAGNNVNLDTVAEKSVRLKEILLFVIFQALRNRRGQVGQLIYLKGLVGLHIIPK